MAELPELPEIHEIHHHAHGDRYGRAIAIITVLATLCAAWTAVLQANAIREHDLAAAKAQELTSETLGERNRSEGSARVQLERFELAEKQRARAALARQELLFSSGARARDLRVQERRWEDIAKDTDAQSEAIAHEDHAVALKPEGEFGPAADPVFPLGYLAQSRHESYKLAAERAGANRKASRAENQYTQFAVSFTMLAIAVFLFGYSLTPHGRPRRRLFAGTASIFVAIAATNALVTSLNPPKAPPIAAAEAYAEGQVALDSSDPHEAVEHFTKAIDLDSGFADAYIGRAQATFLEGAPQRLGSGSGVTTPEALEKVIADERKVRSLGIRDPLFFAELGSDLLALGLHRHDKGHLREAVSLLQRAEEDAHGDATIAYDLGAALTALGRFKEAEHAFEEAVHQTMFVETTEHGKTTTEPRNDEISEEQDLAVGLEGLQNVAERSEGEIAEEAEKLKGHVVEEIAELRVAEQEEAAKEAHGEEEGAGHGEESGGEEEGAGHGEESGGEEEGAGHGEESAEKSEPEAGHNPDTAPAHEGEGEEEPAAEEPHAKKSSTEETTETAPAEEGHGDEAAPEEAAPESEEGHGEEAAPESEEGHGEEAAPEDEEGHGEEAAPEGEEGHGEEQAELHGVKVELTPDATFFEIPKQEGFDKTKDRVTTQWYFQDPDRLGWTVLTEVSRIAQEPVPAGGDPTYHERGDYLGLTTPAACLPEGEYRLEIYVNGHLAYETTREMEIPREGVTLRGLGAGLCLPVGWHQSKERMPGLVDGYLSEDGQAGSYVLSLSPALIGAGSEASNAEAGDILDRVFVRFGDLLPDRPRHGRDGGPEIPNLPGALVRRYRMGDHELLAGIGQTRSGQLLVDLVYGPPDMFADGTAESIFTSLAERT